LLVREHPALPALPNGRVLGDPLTVLWFVPITEGERELAIGEGSAALERRLPRDRWRDA
jgi:hypothetical protein